MDKGYHDSASNRLYYGEVTTFYGACREMIAQYRQEATWIRTKYHRVDPEDAAKGLAEMQGYIDAVEQCRREYAEALQQMEETLAAKWSAQEGEIAPILADALHSGDYSGCAM